MLNYMGGYANRYGCTHLTIYIGLAKLGPLRHASCAGTHMKLLKEPGYNTPWYLGSAIMFEPNDLFCH